MIEFLLICIVAVFALAIFFIPTIPIKAKMKAVQVGKQYVLEAEKGNPWVDEWDIKTVVEMKNGFVRYTYGPDNRSESYLPLKTFAQIYVDYRKEIK